MKIVRLVACAVVAVLVAAGLWALVAPLLEKRAGLVAQRDALKAENDARAEEAAALRRMQEALRADPDYVESVARRENLVRGDETVFDFSESLPSKDRN